ncbi:Nitrate regulatory gene2 protein, partial [Mucuna pruriens]
MGCWQSRIEREEMVSRCEARKRCMKHFSEARRAFSSAHAIYIRSLHTTASALLHFANAHEQIETTLLMDLTSDTPAPPTSSPSWDYWNPFNVSLSSSTVDSSNNDNHFFQVIKQVHQYFLKAADAGTNVSLLLQVPNSAFSTHSKALLKIWFMFFVKLVLYFVLVGKVKSYGWSLSPSLWSRCSSSKQREKNSGAIVGVNGSHCSTVERLYTWEKKLCQEVKNVETIKMEQEKKVARLRMLEMKRGDNMKIGKTKKEVEKLESQITVASHAIETTNAEIIKLRETELYPQLIELVKGLRSMWRSMYECHQVQKHIVQQVEDLNTIPSTNPSSEIHRQSTLELEVGIQQWHQSFCSLFEAHRGYIQSLTAWLRLSLFQFSSNPLNKTAEESKIYTLCEEWNLAVDCIPDKAESEGIESLLTAIHAIVVQQREEYKQKNKLDAALKELEKKVVQLQSIECKHDSYSMLESSDTMGTKDSVTKKRAKVEHLRQKVEKEKTKHENSIRVTRTLTRNNLQMSFPQVFQGIVEFSSVCVKVFESVYNKADIAAVEYDVKRI